MNNDQNNTNLNNFNAQTNNVIPNSQLQNTNQIIGYNPQTGQPIYANQNQPQINPNMQQQVKNKKSKKKKYWLMPIIVFGLMIVCPVLSSTLTILGLDIPLINSMVATLGVICVLGFIPSIIVSIILSCIQK